MPTPALRTKTWVIVLLLSATSSLAAQVVERWTWKNPLPVGNHLNDVEVLGDGSAIAVGDGGMYMVSSDQGASWTFTPHPGGLKTMYAVDFPSATVGYLVGDDNNLIPTVLKTTDGGRTWARQNTNVFSFMYGVAFINEQTGWICGSGGLLLKTTDGGATWNQQDAGFSGDLYDITPHTANTVYASGSGGSLLVTADGGMNWFKRSAGSEDLYSVERTPGAFDGLTAGASGNVFAYNSREVLPRSSPVTNTLRDIAWLDLKNVVIVGDSGTIIRSSDNGNTWSAIPSGIGTDLLGLGSKDTSFQCAAGTFGRLLTSTDAGLTWTQRSSGVFPYLNAVAATMQGRAIAVGAGGAILRKAAADSSWMSVSSSITTTLRACVMISEDIGCAAGNDGTIYRTTDGGAAWAAVSTGSTSRLYGSAASDGSVCFVGNGGTVLRSTDEGASWSLRPSGTSTSLRAVTSVGDSAFIIVGSGGMILRSADDGFTWTQVQSPTGTSLLSVTFGDAANGIIGGSPLAPGLPPIVLRTTDAGETWILRTISTLPTSLNPYAFFDLSAVAARSPLEYVAGSIEGTFFRTTDGGQTWSQIFTGTGKTVTSICRARDRLIAAGQDGMIIESQPDTTVVRVAEVGESHIPESPLALEAFPNPFNPATSVQFMSAQRGYASVSVHTLLGQHVATLYSGVIDAGREYTVSLDGYSLTSGTYFLRIVQGRAVLMKRILLLR